MFENNSHSKFVDNFDYIYKLAHESKYFDQIFHTESAESETKIKSNTIEITVQCKVLGDFFNIKIDVPEQFLTFRHNNIFVEDITFHILTIFAELFMSREKSEINTILECTVSPRNMLKVFQGTAGISYS